MVKSLGSLSLRIAVAAWVATENVERSQVLVFRKVPTGGFLEYTLFLTW